MCLCHKILTTGDMQRDTCSQRVDNSSSRKQGRSRPSVSASILGYIASEKSIHCLLENLYKHPTYLPDNFGWLAVCFCHTKLSKPKPFAKFLCIGFAVQLCDVLQFFRAEWFLETRLAGHLLDLFMEPSCPDSQAHLFPQRMPCRISRVVGTMDQYPGKLNAPSTHAIQTTEM